MHGLNLLTGGPTADGPPPDALERDVLDSISAARAFSARCSRFVVPGMVMTEPPCRSGSSDQAIDTAAFETPCLRAISSSTGRIS